MNIYKILNTQEDINCINFYNALKKLGAFNLCTDGIIVICSKNIKQINKTLNKIFNNGCVIAEQLFDWENSMQSKNAIEWIKLEMKKIQKHEIGKEVKNRTKAMYDILVEANNYIDEKYNIKGDGENLDVNNN